MPDEDLIELVAPGGVDEANHGLVRYRVDNDGRIRVPRQAAFWLIRAGFRMAPVDLELNCRGRRPALPIDAPEPETTAPTEDGDGAEPDTAPRRVPRRSNRT